MQSIQGNKNNKSNEKIELNCKIVQVIQAQIEHYKSCATTVFPVLAEKWNANMTLSITAFLGQFPFFPSFIAEMRTIKSSIMFSK